MSSPKDLKYTKTHEWVKVEGDVAVFGITDHAQAELGDITYIELPEVGSSVSQAEPFGVVESVKAASDVYAPIDGEVVEVNASAVDAPDLVNSSPYEGAWLVKVKISDKAQLEALMDASRYDEFAGDSAH